MKRETVYNLLGLALALAAFWWFFSKWGAVAYAAGAIWGAWDAKRRGGEVFTSATAWPARLAITATDALVARGIPGSKVLAAVVNLVDGWFEGLRRTPK